MLETIKHLINEKEWVEALQETDKFLQKEPNNPLGLFCLGQILLETEKQSIAYSIYKRVTQLEPSRPEGWINMGKSAGELHFYDEEEACFKKALRLAKAQKNKTAEFIAIQNHATCAVHKTEADKAIHWAKKALLIKETNQSKLDLGFASLMKKDFEEGWKNYNAGMGFSAHRQIKNYTGEPIWDGSGDKRVIIYGEQGLGDQIAFAGAIGDARRISKQIILHVNPKLVNFFRRSFVMEVYSYGPDDDRRWLNNREIDASASMSQVQEFFRGSLDKFTGKPYLMADYLQRIQWKALLSELGDKLKVGIAWTGGVQSTQKDARSLDLESLLPILKKDVTWISLEYRDKEDEIKSFQEKHGIKVHDFSRATRTDDYDDTAALVAELDLVISVPTSVVHLAGALGVSCWCITHQHPHFMFGLDGKEMIFYKSVELFRRTNKLEPVNEIGDRLDEMRCNHSSWAGTRKDISKSNRVSSDSLIEHGSV